MKKYLLEEIAPDLLQNKIFKKWAYEIYNIVNDFEDPEQAVDECVYLLDNMGFDTEYLVANDWFSAALSAGVDASLTFLNHYFDIALRWYEDEEMLYPLREDANLPFDCFKCFILSICIKYFEKIKEQEISDLCFLFLMCGLCHQTFSEYATEEEIKEQKNRNYMLCEMFEYKMDSIKSYIFADQQAVHPLITWNIGKYYLLKNNYRKAKEFFSLGASLNYESDLSSEPLFAVGKNQYELGTIYRDGLGVKINPKKAQEYFEMAKCNGINSDDSNNRKSEFNNLFDPFFDETSTEMEDLENEALAEIKTYDEDELTAMVNNFDVERAIEQIHYDRYKMLKIYKEHIKLKNKLFINRQKGVEMIGFWKTKGDFGCFCNWYPAEFKMDSHHFKSSEQAFMYLKAKLFNDTEKMERILKCDGPKEAKRLGRGVKPFDSRVWSKYKYSFMVKVCYEKFVQNPDLKNVLLLTGDEMLVEASPKDKIWGIGIEVNDPDFSDPSKWRGENLLGQALMEVRARLKSRMN